MALVLALLFACGMRTADGDPATEAETTDAQTTEPTEVAEGTQYPLR